MVQCKYRLNINAKTSTGAVIFNCSQLKLCTEEDLGRTFLDGSPLPVCADCKLYQPISKLIPRLTAAVEASERGESVLPPAALALPGMSSNKVRHLLSNLRAENYLEVGSWRGSTLIAAAYKSAGFATAIDNFSQFNDGKVKLDLHDNVEEFCPEGVTLFDESFDLISTYKLPHNSCDVFFYDGDHGLEETRRAMWRAFPALADESIVVIDDTNFTGVFEAAKKGLQDCGAEILFEKLLPARFNGDTEQWWNGVGILVVRKPIGPRVSAICLTYNMEDRAQVLNEAVESFLRQTWPNKELIIVNDDPNLALEFDHPQVTILQFDTRFATLGEKYNAGCFYATGEILCSWDDDDISLPWRMKQAVDKLKDSDYWNPKAYWYANAYTIVHEYKKNYHHNASAFRKSAWESVGQYKHLNGSQDAALDGTLSALTRTVIGSGNLEETAYIYRWNDGLQHISGGDMDANYERNGQLNSVEKHLIEPQWQKDYIAITRKLILVKVIDRNKIALTIGMACCNDYTGVHETIMSLRMNHRKALERCEILVIDNSTDNYRESQIEADGKTPLQRFVESSTNCKYIRYTEIRGTSAPRNKVFEHASGEAVLLIDSHVQFGEGVIQKLINFYDANPNTNDLYCGPIVGNDGSYILATEMKPGFRGLMNGMWHLDLPAFEAGQPYPIWGHGCGLLTCRRSSWAGFSAYQRGFGGEEGYIHAKTRLRGDSVYCLPWLLWCHRWGNFSGITYGTIEQRIQNYIYSSYEIGEPSITEIEQHFVAEEKKVTSEKFEELRHECAQTIFKDKGGKGVGTELTKLLGWFGFYKIPGACNCQLYADAMDVNGVEWCKNSKPIISGWLKEGAEKRGIPFSATLASIAVNRAVANASS